MSKFRLLKRDSAAGTLLAVAVSLSPGMLSFSAHAVVSDPVVFKFSTVGDSRQDPRNADPTTKTYNGNLLLQDQQWLQNTKAWARILRTIQSQKANLLMVNGDLVMGYGRAAVPATWGTNVTLSVTDITNSDLVQFYTQYAYWRGMVANSLETGTYVIPVPGNHETQCNASNITYLPANSKSVCSSGKHAYSENEDAWRANMGDLIGDLSTNLRFQSVVGAAPQNVSGLTQATAPTSTTDASITSNQADLSYSFDVSTAAGLLHFVVINTDAANWDSHAPIGWLANDLAAAKLRSVAKIFVFGHKPAFTYDYLGNGLGSASNQVNFGGLDVDLTARNNFWKTITQYNATYFSGHEHTSHIDAFADPTGTYTGTPYHVLVGGGGSPFDPKPTDVTVNSSTDRMYAWATVSVLKSGAVKLELYGFDSSFGPTQIIQTISQLQ